MTTTPDLATAVLQGVRDKHGDGRRPSGAAPSGFKPPVPPAPPASLKQLCLAIVAATNAAITAAYGAAAPSGENASTPSVTSTGSTVSAPVHAANISRAQPGLVWPSSLQSMVILLVKLAQFR